MAAMLGLMLPGQSSPFLWSAGALGSFTLLVRAELSRSLLFVICFLALSLFSLATDGPLLPHIIWIFAEMRCMGFLRQSEDRFACSILRSWEQLWPFLIQCPPSCIEQLHHPIA
ncbi:hypothetical protein KP509_38G056600 [Ceratopteris richardii]|uniref:Uncharacterized protein n=1 Tax=Ceratopteris richardii TaxID=49495 RepID=A0A8T2Q576_CERRI|nr:hypothetical protein KP509_38G056600 [Ceratopteris richardii]